MKKILVLSDTHGDIDMTRRILQKHQDVDLRIHLGDVGFDLHEISSCCIVKGNHDRTNRLPMERIFQIEDKRLLCLHGNLFDEETVQEVFAIKGISSDKLMDLCMKILYTKLKNHAKEKHCDIVLFGHTHHQCCEELDGVLLINPGSICLGTPHNGYAIVCIDHNDVKVKLLQC